MLKRFYETDRLVRNAVLLGMQIYIFWYLPSTFFPLAIGVGIITAWDVLRRPMVYMVGDNDAA